MGRSVILGDGTDLAFLANWVHAGDDAGAELERLPDEPNVQGLEVDRDIGKNANSLSDLPLAGGSRPRHAGEGRARCAALPPLSTPLSDLVPTAQKFVETRSPCS